jgi:hypothetical protein
MKSKNLSGLNFAAQVRFILFLLKKNILIFPDTQFRFSSGTTLIQ